MMTGALNSLVWILILILIVAVVVAVMRATSRPRGGTVVEQPVVQQPAVRQPPATSGLAPGWYPDQNDPNSMRYFDGRVWTAQTEPRA